MESKKQITELSKSELRAIEFKKERELLTESINTFTEKYGKAIFGINAITCYQKSWHISFIYSPEHFKEHYGFPENFYI